MQATNFDGCTYGQGKACATTPMTIVQQTVEHKNQYKYYNTKFILKRSVNYFIQ